MSIILYTPGSLMRQGQGAWSAFVTSLADLSTLPIGGKVAAGELVIVNLNGQAVLHYRVASGAGSINLPWTSDTLDSGNHLVLEGAFVDGCPAIWNFDQNSFHPLTASGSIGSERIDIGPAAVLP